jgi:hypothetical protein
LARECVKIGKNQGHIMRVMQLSGLFEQGLRSESVLPLVEKLRDDGLSVFADPGHLYT